MLLIIDVHCMFPAGEQCFYCWFRTFGIFSFVDYIVLQCSASCILRLFSVSLCFSLCMDMNQWRILLPQVKSGLCCVSKLCSSFLRWNIVLYKFIMQTFLLTESWWETCLFIYLFFEYAWKEKIALSGNQNCQKVFSIWDNF